MIHEAGPLLRESPWGPVSPVHTILWPPCGKCHLLKCGQGGGVQESRAGSTQSKDPSWMDQCEQGGRSSGLGTSGASLCPQLSGGYALLVADNSPEPAERALQ